MRRIRALFSAEGKKPLLVKRRSNQCPFIPGMLIMQVQVTRSRICIYATFRPVAEMARVHPQPDHETPVFFRRALQRRRQNRGNPRGFLLLGSSISATLVRVEIASPPPVFFFERPDPTADLPVEVAHGYRRPKRKVPAKKAIKLKRTFTLLTALFLAPLAALLRVTKTLSDSEIVAGSR
jgi:hypothetical protein